MKPETKKGLKAFGVTLLFALIHSFGILSQNYDRDKVGEYYKQYIETVNNG